MFSDISLSKHDLRHAPLLRINYGVSRSERDPKSHRRKYSCKNGKLSIRGNWDEDATQKRIRAKIRDREPGWMISGYCLATPSKD